MEDFCMPTDSKVLNNSDDNYENEEQTLDPESLSLPEKLLWASENNRLDIIQNILKSNLTILNDTKDDDGYTPLHRACSNNCIEIVKYLIENGSQIDAKTNDGWTPLHSACHWNHFECVVTLVEAGADINALTQSKQTPLHITASNRCAKETMKILLINKCIDVNLVNSIGETARQLANRLSPFSYMFDWCDFVSDYHI